MQICPPHAPFVCQLLEQDSDETQALARGVIEWTDAHNLAVKDLNFVMTEFRAKRGKLEEQAGKPVQKKAKRAWFVAER